jgi:hypothetical protein
MLKNKYVIYHKEEKVLIADNQNNIVLFNTEHKALEDCRRNEKVIAFDDLNIHFKKQLENQMEKLKLVSVSKALAKMLEIQSKSEATKYNAELNTKFKIKYNRIFNHYKNLCEQYYY